MQDEGLFRSTVGTGSGVQLYSRWWHGYGIVNDGYPVRSHTFFCQVGCGVATNSDNGISHTDAN